MHLVSIVLFNACRPTAMIDYVGACMGELLDDCIHCILFCLQDRRADLGGFHPRADIRVLRANEACTCEVTTVLSGPSDAGC